MMPREGKPTSLVFPVICNHDIELYIRRRSSLFLCHTPQRRPVNPYHNRLTTFIRLTSCPPFRSYVNCSLRGAYHPPPCPRRRKKPRRSSTIMLSVRSYLAIKQDDSETNFALFDSRVQQILVSALPRFEAASQRSRSPVPSR